MQNVLTEISPVLENTTHKSGFARNWLWVTEYKKGLVCLFVFSATDPPRQCAIASSYTRFLDHIQQHTTPLD